MLERIKRLLLPDYEYKLTRNRSNGSWSDKITPPETGFTPWKWLLSQEHGEAFVAVVWRRRK